MSRPTPDREQRILPVAGLEVRVSQTGEPPQIEGYAAVFNQPSDVIADFVGGGFREFVLPGAFTKTLKDGADVRALLNHDPNFVLGRTKTGTLSLKEDEKGLYYRVTPPDTQWARDLVATMRRGDIDQSSFAFRTVRDRWGVGAAPDGGQIDERWVIEAQLFDVSPVTYPAYPQATSSVRSLLTAAGIDDDTVRALERARRGLPLSPSERGHVRDAIAHITALLPADEPTSSGHSEPTGDDAPVQPDHAPAAVIAPVFIDADRAARLRARLNAAERTIRGA